MRLEVISVRLKKKPTLVRITSGVNTDRSRSEPTTGNGRLFELHEPPLPSMMVENEPFSVTNTTMACTDWTEIVPDPPFSA